MKFKRKLLKVGSQNLRGKKKFKSGQQAGKRRNRSYDWKLKIECGYEQNDGGENISKHVCLHRFVF